MTTDTNTYAIDPATCQQKWKHHYEKPTPEGLRVNRGVAYADGKVFRGINTGYLLALDANTGRLLWESKMADPEKGESIPAAPIAWNGMVFIGHAAATTEACAADEALHHTGTSLSFISSFDGPWQTPGRQHARNPRTGGATDSYND